MPHSPLPLRFDYLPAWQAVLLYLLLALPVLWLGARSMTGLDSFRKWTAVAIRLDLLMFIVLLLAGARWEQTPKDLTVVVVRDISRSTTNVRPTRAGNAQGQVAQFLRAATRNKPTGDRIGEVSFDRLPLIDALPNPCPLDCNRGMRDPVDGTDVAQALGLAMATMPAETRRRIALLWDGNLTCGDLDTAVDAAAAQHIPIDVVPLNYHVDREIAVDRLVAPAARKSTDPLTLDVVIRSDNIEDVRASISITDNDEPIDVDAATPGVQHERIVRLSPGTHVEHVAVAPLPVGLHRFHVALQAIGGGDTIRDNNAADALTIVRGQTRVLLVNGDGATDSCPLRDAMVRAGVAVDQQSDAAAFPRSLPELAQYDAVVLADVARGFNGLDEMQDRLLATYVRDLGGGLVMVGGPNAFGAGGWAGSHVASVLPVDCQPHDGRPSPPGALVLAIDRSGSMGESIHGTATTKLSAAADAAVAALRTLHADDRVGVVAFDTQCTWVAPLAENRRPDTVAAAIRHISASGDTDIHAALVAAREAMTRDALIHRGGGSTPVRHVVLLTDGRSVDADFIAEVARMRLEGVTLSTIGVGTDIDDRLLSFLAWMGHGKFYRVTDPALLRSVFVREATTLRDTVVEERPIVPRATGSLVAMTNASALPALHGMVATWAKPLPGVETPLVADDTDEPLLARWRCGLGRVAAFTSDADDRWAAEWVRSPVFDQFWSDVVRGVTRRRTPAGVTATVVQTAPGHAKLVVETAGDDNAPPPVPALVAAVIGPDARQPARDVRLRQSSEGVYEGEFTTPDDGAYVAAVPLAGAAAADTILAAHVAGGSRELRDLSSNEQAVRDIARRTGGRVLSATDPSVDLFARADLPQQPVSLPLTEKLIALAIATLLLDVAVRRLAWDRHTFGRVRVAVADTIRAFTQVRVGDPEFSLGALLYVHCSLNEKRQQVTPPAYQGGTIDVLRQRGRSTTLASPPSTSLREVVSYGTASRSRAEEIRPAPAATIDALLVSHRRRTSSSGDGGDALKM